MRPCFPYPWEIPPCSALAVSHDATPPERSSLRPGDMLMFGGPARLMYHGVDRVQAGSSGLVPGGGRINLTLRRVTDPKKKAAG